ncbi:MAG: glycosyltransferase, partial [Deltaproteobacteria bacterium]|nr:glycosyltransferase [Deltaproteobacteria bacterium]
MTIANDLTAVVVTRHGHGTTALTIDGLHRQSVRPGRVLVADIASPDRVAERLSTDSRVEHIRIDQLVSRQEARRRCLEEVDTELVLLLDNNMLLADGAIDAMLAAAAETGAVQVGPLVATRGGSVHYSGGVFERARSLSSLGRRIASRRQDAGGQFLTPVEEIQGGRKKIEFVESHCGLARTEALRRPGVLVEGMHNAHTMC